MTTTPSALIDHGRGVQAVHALGEVHRRLGAAARTARAPYGGRTGRAVARRRPGPAAGSPWPGGPWPGGPCHSPIDLDSPFCASRSRRTAASRAGRPGMRASVAAAAVCRRTVATPSHCSSRPGGHVDVLHAPVRHDDEVPDEEAVRDQEVVGALGEAQRPVAQLGHDPAHRARDEDHCEPDQAAAPAPACARARRRR